MDAFIQIEAVNFTVETSKKKRNKKPCSTGIIMHIFIAGLILLLWSGSFKIVSCILEPERKREKRSPPVFINHLWVIFFIMWSLQYG